MTERLFTLDCPPRVFDAIVTDIQEFSRASGQTLWRMALNRTAFAPVPAMQPGESAWILGRLIATARSGAELAAEIVYVEEDSTGQIWHHTFKPLQIGTPIRGQVDAIEVDAPKRSA